MTLLIAPDGKVYNKKKLNDLTVRQILKIFKEIHVDFEDLLDMYDVIKKSSSKKIKTRRSKSKSKKIIYVIQRPKKRKSKSKSKSEKSNEIYIPWYYSVPTETKKDNNEKTTNNTIPYISKDNTVIKVNPCEGKGEHSCGFSSQLCRWNKSDNECVRR